MARASPDRAAVRMTNSRSERVTFRLNAQGANANERYPGLRPRVAYPNESPHSLPAWQTELAHAIAFRDAGEVAERLKAPHSKCGIGASLSGVRIPPSPPLTIVFFEFF
jgi:hypothetical protein